MKNFLLKYKKEIITILIAVLISFGISFNFYKKSEERIRWEKCFIWYQIPGNNPNNKDLSTYLTDCKKVDQLFH